MSAYADPTRLYFFFDYISHNAYLAWHRAPAIAARHGLKLTPVPVVFGALLSHYRQIGPASCRPSRCGCCATCCARR